MLLYLDHPFAGTRLAYAYIHIESEMYLFISGYLRIYLPGRDLPDQIKYLYSRIGLVYDYKSLLSWIEV